MVKSNRKLFRKGEQDRMDFLAALLLDFAEKNSECLTDKKTFSKRGYEKMENHVVFDYCKITKENYVQGEHFDNAFDGLGYVISPKGSVV